MKSHLPFLIALIIVVLIFPSCGADAEKERETLDEQTQVDKDKQSYMTSSDVVNDDDKAKVGIEPDAEQVSGQDDLVTVSDPSDADEWYNKGVALGNLGRDDDAIRCYDKAIEINPNDAEAWHNKGAALYYLKQYSAARKAFEKADSLGNEKAREILDLLKSEGY